MAYDSHLDPGRLVPGEITPVAEGIFTGGGCGALAIAMHDETGWPIIGVTDAHNVHDGRVGGGSCMHWCVRAPDGRYVDIDGAHDPDELVARYHGEADDNDAGEPEAVAGVSSRDDAVEWYEEQGARIPLDVARSFVPAVLRRIKEAEPSGPAP